jgi:phospholipase/carboxylesterase
MGAKDIAMTLDAIELQAGDTPRFSLIVLHGLGADGQDFVPVCQALDLAPLLAQGGLRCVLPHAPVMPVSLNGGQPMRAWYDIRPDIAPDDPRGREDEAGLRASQQAISALIERECREHGIAPERIVLMGFSQGCAMTLLTGLRHPQRLAGLVGLSGYLPLLRQTEAEAHPANAATEIFLAHGRQDAVVLPQRALASRDELLRLGHRVQWQDYPMGHEVCEPEIQALSDWLLQRWLPG